MSKTKPNAPRATGKKLTQEWQHPETLAQLAEFGQRIREVRRIVGWVQARLASESQISLHSLRMIEDGHPAEMCAYFSAARGLRVPFKRFFSAKETWAAWVKALVRAKEGKAATKPKIKS